MRLIDVDKLVENFRKTKMDEVFPDWKYLGCIAKTAVIRLTTKYRAIILNAPTVEVVRCHDCIHAVPLERNCELNTNLYMHCNLWRGDETKNVWHKYKRFYKDYSLVEHDDFCSYGERKETDGRSDRV